MPSSATSSTSLYPLLVSFLLPLLFPHLIYRVHFLAEGRTIGCREEELIAASEPWVPNRYEFRDAVYATRALAIRGEVVVAVGQEGSVMKVLRDLPEAMGIQYHVHFGDGRLYQVPEASLAPLEATLAESLEVQHG